MRPHRRGSRRRRRPVFVWLLVIAVLVAAAVVAGRTFRARVPARPPVAAPARIDVQVFLVRAAAGGRGETLAPVHRRVTAGATPALVASSLEALLEGPSRGERLRGLASEIPPGTVLRGVAVSGGVATVDLGVSFAQGGGSSSILGRVWQVVYTASQFPNVSSVQLLIGGRRVDTLGGEGLLIGSPLRRQAAMPTF